MRNRYIITLVLLVCHVGIKFLKQDSAMMLYLSTLIELALIVSIIALPDRLLRFVGVLSLGALYQKINMHLAMDLKGKEGTLTEIGNSWVDTSSGGWFTLIILTTLAAVVLYKKIIKPQRI